MKTLLLFSFTLILAGCFSDETTPKPTPLAMTDESTGYFCMMNVAEHPGPKAQAFVAGQEQPVWFPSVRDLLTFRRLPGENAEIIALYVSDTAASPNYDQIDANRWLDAETAYYVIGSMMLSGMGLSEAVPFANAEQAETFAAERGGTVVRIDEIGEEWLFNLDIETS